VRLRDAAARLSNRPPLCSNWRPAPGENDHRVLTRHATPNRTDPTIPRPAKPPNPAPEDPSQPLNIGSG